MKNALLENKRGSMRSPTFPHSLFVTLHSILFKLTDIEKKDIAREEKTIPQVSCKTYISQECRSLDEGNIFMIKKTNTYQKKADKVKRRKKGTVLNIIKM